MPLVVVGTRPEIIKMSPIIRESPPGLQVLHTGQHYSHKMDRIFFEELGLPDPDHHLDVGSGPHGAQTAKMLAGIEKALLEERPDWVLVQGDTNSVLAGTLAATKMGIPVGHVEAGLRSDDRSMPEEQNRIVADHLSELLFTPTPEASRRALSEGIAESRVRMTGNTIVDAVHQNKERCRGAILDRLRVEKKGFLMMTAHRQENVDHPDRLRAIVAGAVTAGREAGMPVVFSVHPRTRKQIEALRIDTQGLQLMDPVGYLDFLDLQMNAALVMTDSGGVQEETCILGTPCITMRDNTERPETIDVGANVLVGADTDRIVSAVAERLGRPADWSCPFGDGHAARRILEAIA